MVCVMKGLWDCRFVHAVTAALCLACGAGGNDQGDKFAEGEGTDDTATGATASTDDAADGTSAGDEDTGGGVKYDVGADGTGDENDGCGPNGDEACGCTAVDVLFVVDNSESMHDHQVALGNAFPEFAAALVNVLPPGTSLHVGVTSTEMGYTASDHSDGCGVTGDPYAFYTTPDQVDTGRDGAQGRLYDSGDMSFYEVDTDASQAAIDGLTDWFGGAALIGTDGSAVEMAAAPAAWATHPSNAATNAGFVRDEGAILVLFFIQDEPDQTPGDADVLLDMIADAKQGCGGLNCVVGGGLVNTACLAERPLGGLLYSLGAPPAVAAIPYYASSDPAPFVEVLRDTLANVIGEKCAEIPPP